MIIALRTPLFLLGLLPITTLQLWTVDSLAQTPTPIPGSMEAAVLHIDDGRMLALPVLSLPVDPRQIPSLSDGGIERRLFANAAIKARIAGLCPRNEESTTKQCAIPSALVAQHHYMRTTPGQWLDSAGRKYRTLGGRSFVTASPDSESGVGFDLGPVPSGPDGLIHIEGRVLLSDAGGFPATEPIPPSIWKYWPELAQELTTWSSRQIEQCGQSSTCVQTAKQLAAPDRLQGDARTYKLPDGRRLQYLHATSRSDGPDPDELTIHLWLIANADGSRRVMRIKGNDFFRVSFSKRELVRCESQCGTRWRGRPEMVAAHGRTFIFGPFESSAEARGSIFFEVLSTELEFLGWYDW